MNRREILKATLGSAALAASGGTTSAVAGIVGQSDKSAARLPSRDRVRVAFLLGDETNLIDVAGPWEVFHDTHLPDADSMRSPFELFTVSSKLDGLKMTGGFMAHAHYIFSKAPQPHLIVVPAHRTTPESQGWLRQASVGADLTMSVCVGAFPLAEAGLLDGLAATTHHDFWNQFAQRFPRIELRRGPRFVDNGRVASAAGLTSGVDLALHVTARYFGVDVATTTAAYLEHLSDAWRSPNSFSLFPRNQDHHATVRA